MKAKPMRLIYGVGYEPCTTDEATHVQLRMPGPSKNLFIPVILKGSRADTGKWSWNGDTEKPTLRPSVLTRGGDWVCHSWINDGEVVFLSDCTHDLKDTTVALLDVE